MLLCVRVVVKTVNLKISRCHLVGNVKELYLSACGTCGTCSTCSTIVCPHSTNHIIHLLRFCCLGHRRFLNPIMIKEDGTKIEIVRKIGKGETLP